MKRDFTLEIYGGMIDALLTSGYQIVPVREYMESKEAVFTKHVILRHDVDKFPQRSLDKARVENSLGVCATYYFRTIQSVFDTRIIHEISALGHEIGYHYEDFAMTGGNIDAALESFTLNLMRLRDNAEIKTICMHGSPTSKYDNRLMWRKREYLEIGLLGEAYLDIDYTNIAYISDTGRTWKSNRGNRRDKVLSGVRYPVETTFEIIHDLVSGRAPHSLAVTTHPQRWIDQMSGWLYEYIAQNGKNLIKRFLK